MFNCNFVILCLDEKWGHMSLVCFEILCSTVDNLGRDALVERVKVIELNNKNRSAGKIAKDLGVGKNPGSQVHHDVHVYLSHSKWV